MNPQAWKVRACLYHQGRRHEYEMTGRVAQTLFCLVHAGRAGITAAEISCWAYRLGAYVHTLRKRYSLDIVTHTEPHDGGRHGRYELIDAVELLEVTRPQ